MGRRDGEEGKEGTYFPDGSYVDDNIYTQILSPSNPLSLLGLLSLFGMVSSVRSRMALGREEKLESIRRKRKGKKKYGKPSLSVRKDRHSY